MEIFEKAKEQDDTLLCILLSSALSGTYQSAVLAKSIVEYDGIYLIDSLSATVGTVSYTHLDVYKRQIEDPMKKVRSLAL